MAGKAISHSENWWTTAPAHILRCNGTYVTTGTQCRREAVGGTPVCFKHGATAPQTLAKAATRIQLTADEAVKVLHGILTNPEAQDRDKIAVARDLLDRGGLVPTNKVLLGVVTDDPVEKLFRDLLSDPRNLVDPNATPALPSAEQLERDRRAYDAEEWDGLPDLAAREDVVDAEVAEDDEDVLGYPLVISSEPPRRIREGFERLARL